LLPSSWIDDDYQGQECCILSQRVEHGIDPIARAIALSSEKLYDLLQVQAQSEHLIKDYVAMNPQALTDHPVALTSFESVAQCVFPTFTKCYKAVDPVPVLRYLVRSHT
jgi:hypothetical protein